MKYSFCMHVHFKYEIENVTFYIQKLLQFSEPIRTLNIVQMGNIIKKEKTWSEQRDFFFLLEKTSNNYYSVHKIIKKLNYRAAFFLSKNLCWFECVCSSIKSRNSHFISVLYLIFFFNQIERRWTWISSNFRNEK